MMVNQEVIQSEHLLSKGDSHLYKRVGVCQISLYGHLVGIITERYEGVMYSYPQKGSERLV